MHYDHLSPKVESIAAPLSFLPNCKVRRLYSGVINSMILYGSPIWYRHISNYGNSILRTRYKDGWQQGIRGYRTVAYKAAITLAGMTPHLEIAGANAITYNRIQDI